MKRISADYDTHTKDELYAEADARKIEGLNSASNKGDIVTALQKHDAAALKAAAINPVPSPLPANIPVVKALETADLPQIPGQAPKDTEYKGNYKELSSGEPYALAVVPDGMAVDGKTHFAKNTLHFWNGTAAQFRDQFEKQ